MLKATSSDITGAMKKPAKKAAEVSSTEHSTERQGGCPQSPPCPSSSQGKVFSVRSSKLTEMFQVAEFRTIYNIFVAVLLVLACQTLYMHLVEEKPWQHFDLIFYGFGQFPTVILTWQAMFLQVLQDETPESNIL